MLVINGLNNAACIAKGKYVAMLLVVLRPFITNIKSNGELIVTLENYFFMAMVIIALFIAFIKRNQFLNSPIIWTCLTISFFLLIFIGYTVCFEGAIVRYRSVSFPFLIVPCVVIIWGNTKLPKVA